MVSAFHRTGQRLAGVLLALCATAGMARAEFPDRPLTIVVPFAAGGQSDVTARLLAEKLQAIMGQPVLVENKGGGGTMIGAEFVARSAPDGYTILFGGGSSVVTPHFLYTSPPYAPDALAPITQGVKFGWVLESRPDLPATTIAELVEFARTQPQGLTYANTGKGSLNHLTGALIGEALGIELVDVSYPGMAQAATDLMAGRIDLAVEGVSTAAPNHLAGKTKILAYTGADRSSQIPDIPTLAEQGHPDLVINTWLGFFAPKDTPPEVIETWNLALGKALTDPDITKVLDNQGQPADPGTAAEFESFIEAERALWGPIIIGMGLKLD